MAYLSDNLMKYNAKDLFIKCIIVYLAYDDDISAESFLKKFEDEDPTLPDTKHADLMHEIIKAYQERDSQKFKRAVTDFRKTNDLDNWMVEMLTRIMTKLEAKKNEVEEDYR